MAFIDTSETIIGVEIQQIDARYIAPGQPVELTFKFAPGQIYTGKVQAIASGKAAIFTDRVKAAHMIQKVLLRQFAILNYVNPF